MTVIRELKKTVDGHTDTLGRHAERIEACEKYDENQRQFYKRLRTHITRWGMGILGAVMATGILDNRAAHVIGAFIHGLMGQP